MSVIVYSKPNCPNCELSKRDMDILGIEYQVIDISQDIGSLERLKSQGFRSVPVIQTENDVWSGYNQEKIKGLVSYA